MSHTYNSVPNRSAGPNKRASVIKTKQNKEHAGGKSGKFSSKLINVPAPLFGTKMKKNQVFKTYIDLIFYNQKLIFGPCISSINFGNLDFGTF